jgi:N-acetylmuramoyl-L-alanine amidase
MIGSYRAILCLLCCIVALAGCAAHKPPPENIYAGLKEEPRELDTSVLAGKRIVIDPGHGGSFDGAIGADSLREADANLGVALYLWGLCADAGAIASLTRTADRDHLPAGSRESGDDLKARVAKANELDPDAFISIHHNANLPVKRDVNKIEVYYRASDPGASLELAEELQVHLARNLGIQTAEVRPGNYAMLRLSNAHAAVLGEASYLSHPAVEERLKLSAKQKLEAEAYFFGLVGYFAKGVPTIQRISPAADSLTSPAEISFAVQSSAGIALDPTSARVSIGASEVIPLFDEAKSVIRVSIPPDAPNETYAVRATIRSMRGATARSKPYSLVLARPARHILPLEARPESESTVSLSVKVLDELGGNVANGTEVTAVSLKDGKRFTQQCSNGSCAMVVPRERAREAFAFQTEGITDTIRFAPPEASPRIAIIATDALTRNRIPYPLIGRRPFETVTGDSQGRAFIPASNGVDSVLVHAPGYKPAFMESIGARAAGDIVHVALEPLFGGVLQGKRLALDPAGGGADPGGRGTNGLRGASVNLSVARCLRSILERAGSDVTLTRAGDEPISAQERVYIVNRSEADLAIGIRHEAPPAPIEGTRSVLHYPGSRGGALLAEKLAAALAALPPGGVFSVDAWASLFLQQTACTACEIYGGPVEDEAMEAAMSDNDWLRLEAEEIFAAVLRYFGCDSLLPAALAVKVTMNGAPAPGAAVDIDQALTRLTDAHGLAVFTCVEAGRHLVSVRLKDGRSALFKKNLVSNDSGMLLLEIR